MPEPRHFQPKVTPPDMPCGHPDRLVYCSECTCWKRDKAADLGYVLQGQRHALAKAPDRVRLEPDETLVLAGRSHAPLLRIDLAQQGCRWYFRTRGNGAPHGWGGPLGYTSGRPDEGAHTSRDAALKAAIAHCRWKMSSHSEASTRHRAWLDELERTLDQGDLFSHATAAEARDA